MGSLSYPVIMPVVALLLGLLVGFYFRKRVIEGNEKNIKIQSKQIIENCHYRGGTAEKRGSSAKQGGRVSG